MSERIPLRGGDEQDALTGWRKAIRFSLGQRKRAKRSYIKRLRKWTKQSSYFDEMEGEK